jgi:hypothetical protein
VEKYVAAPLFPWAKASLGGTTRNHFKEWLRNRKMAKSFSWALYFKCFHNYRLLFFHVYQLKIVIYSLKFILELKKKEIVEKLYS